MTKKTYRDYVANGICPNCRSRPTGTNTGVFCETCYQRRQISYRERKTDTKCRDCGGPAVPGKSRCQTCLAKAADVSKRKREFRVSNKLCRECSTPLPPDTKRQVCDTCSAKESELNKTLRIERALAGVCVSCGKELDDLSYKSCSTCRAKNLAKVIKYYHQRREANLCTYCGQPVEPDSPSEINCTACYKKNRKHRVTTNSRQRYGGNLQAVMERDGQCVICGKLTKLVCHHMNSDITHNDLTNLVILCRKCHLLITMWIDCTSKQSMLDFLLKNYPIK